YADLTNAVFINVTLDSTVFKHANLQGAYFYGAKENQYSLFGNADLSNSMIFNSHFENSSFISAEITNARIENTLFNNADILNANFSGSIIKNCDFSDADFNAAGGLFLDGVDDIITVESPGSIPAGTGAFSMELAIVPQNKHKIAGLASFNHRSNQLNTLFELYLDAGFHLVFQYKIAGENTIHTLVSNDTLTGQAYNLIMITYNQGDVKFYIENKPAPVTSSYYSFSDATYNGTNIFPATDYSPKPGESVEAIRNNLILGGFSGICPFTRIESVDSTCAAMAILYFSFWQSVPDDSDMTLLYPLQTNENGETGYPFYYQIEEAPADYTGGLKNNMLFFTCKEQLIKDTKDVNLVIYKGANKGEDDKDPLYHIVNKNFENTLIENTPMFFGW
ncbi:MAG: pentapeptide repeat-containing protein, partial [Alphaproteobacteria bacterium]